MILKWFRRTPPNLGRKGEHMAARRLQRDGYRILHRNLELGRYEIDIVAQKDDLIAFVEVKTRTGAQVVDPAESVDREKQRHIRIAADRYIARRKGTPVNYRFDIVTVVVFERGKPEITHYPNAF